MNPLVSSAVAAVSELGFDFGEAGSAVHVREINGVSIVSPDPDAADRIRMNVQDTKDVVVFLARGASLVGLSVRGSGHVIAVGRDTRVGGVTIYGASNLVTFGASTSLATSNVVRGTGIRLEVGSGCIAEGGTIRTSDDHTIFDVASGTPINRARNVRIGNRVYLGRNARVSKGADVGDGVVVAPDSVVAGKLLPGCLYGGVPARLMRERVTWAPRSWSMVKG